MEFGAQPMADLNFFDLNHWWTFTNTYLGGIYLRALAILKRRYGFRSKALNATEIAKNDRRQQDPEDWRGGFLDGMNNNIEIQLQDESRNWRTMVITGNVIAISRAQIDKMRR